MPQKKIFKVTEFNRFIQSYLQKIGEVIVEGEVSKIDVNQGQWLFITIKDEESSVEIFSTVEQISNYETLEEGMLVHIYGIPRLYKKTGRFSIFANQIIPAGEGALKVAFEKLKVKLEKEGLFALERKRPIPRFPENIGLITAKNSSAYSDFIKVLSERMGGINIYFYPVRVQGRGSIESIISAFTYFNRKLSNLDLVVLTRGGGKLENLMSFNDEKVVRSIFSSKIPIVCGIGHENDITLADLVADIRASTPSNAAELIVKDKVEVLRQVDEFFNLIYLYLTRLLKQKNQNVYYVVSRLENSAGQKIKELHSLISKFIREFTLYRHKIKQIFTDTESKKWQLIRTVKFWYQETINKLNNLVRLLKSLDYHRVLERGFSITTDKNGLVVRGVDGVKKNADIKSLLINGTIYSKVFKTEVKND